MVMYAVEALREAGIDELLLVTGGDHVDDFHGLLGDGLEYATQANAGGIAQALDLARDFVGDDRVAVLLADNIYGGSIAATIHRFERQESGARVLLAHVRETEHLGMSNMWRWDDAGAPKPFGPVPWALNLEMEDFPYPKRNHAEWFWESGFNVHPIYGLEETRDWNFRAIYGAWNAMKNKGGKAEHANARLE